MSGPGPRRESGVERFALVEVPSGSAPETVSVRGRTVALEPIRN